MSDPVLRGLLRLFRLAVHTRARYIADFATTRAFDIEHEKRLQADMDQAEQRIVDHVEASRA